MPMIVTTSVEVANGWSIRCAKERIESDTWKKNLIGGSNGGISETFVAVEISIVQSESPLS